MSKCNYNNNDEDILKCKGGQFPQLETNMTSVPPLYPDNVSGILKHKCIQLSASKTKTSAVPPSTVPPKSYQNFSYPEYIPSNNNDASQQHKKHVPSNPKHASLNANDTPQKCKEHAKCNTKMLSQPYDYRFSALQRLDTQEESNQLANISVTGDAM